MYLRIALVDDDPLVGKALERLLRSVGSDVHAHTSALNFLESSDFQFDCVILDLCMPAMGGFELYERLQENGIEIPAVFMSAHEDALHRLTARLPDSPHLAKPFEDDELIDAIMIATGMDRPTIGGPNQCN